MPFDPDAFLAAPAAAATAPPLAFDPDAFLASRQPVAPQNQFGRGLASLADTTVGAIIPAVAQQVGYALARPGHTPQDAQERTQRVVSALDKPFGKLFGVENTPEYKGEASRRLMDFIGQNFQKGAAWIAQATGMPASDIENMMGTATLAVPVKPIASAVKNTLAPVVENAMTAAKAPFQPSASTMAARQAKSYADAPILDAAKTAAKLNVIVDPAVTNPTMSNRLKGAVVGKELQNTAVPQNAAQITNLVRENLGVKPTEKLTAASVEKALADASPPYEVVRKLPDMVLTDDIRGQLQGLRKSDVIGSEGGSALSNGVVDHALDLLEPKTKGTSLLTTKVQGRSGAELLKDIRDLRRAAQDTYKKRDAGGDPGQAALDAADTRYAAAKILEDLIDQNVKDPAVIADLKAARTRMAQIYEHERAIDYANQTVDPQAYVKMYNEGKGAMSGLGAEIAQVASQFPNMVKSTSPKEKTFPALRGGGAGAVTGGVLGAAVGPLIGLDIRTGAAAGGAAGAIAGALGGRGAAKRIASPAYQARNALAKDYRQPQPTPAEINYGPNQLVPFDPRNAVTGAAPEGPNFSFGRPGPYVSPDMPSGPPQLGLSSAQEVLNGLAQERARAAGMSRTLGQQEEARQAAAEAAARVPTGAGQLFDLDPITGRLVSASAGIKGATPATFSDFGMALKTAAEKVTAGRNFDLTAAEKVAWSKTKIDFATAAPELKGMSDAQIAGKIMDREWAADAVKKAREKAQAFDDIAKRAQTAQQKFNAEKSRDELLDALTSLEENIRGPRPTRSGAQGPKTRAAIGNKMAPAPTNRLILD
jgi:hypothetical protein